MIARRESALYPYYDLPAEIAWPHEMIVRIGVVLSSLGAALQSLVGAPRVLQAISNDNLMPILKRFGGNGEPRLAVLLTACICAACVATGKLVCAELVVLVGASKWMVGERGRMRASQRTAASQRHRADCYRKRLRRSSRCSSCSATCL